MKGCGPMEPDADDKKAASKKKMNKGKVVGGKGKMSFGGKY